MATTPTLEKPESAKANRSSDSMQRLARRPMRRAQRDFLRGYYCCLASILNSHGDNTHIEEALHGAGTTEEIKRYADSGDVEVLTSHGYLAA